MIKKSLRLKRRKKRVSFVRRRYFWHGTAALSFLVFLFYAAVLSPWVEIQGVRVQGTQEIARERIAAAVESFFWQSFLGVPQNSILLARTAELERKLREAFPAIEAVSVKRSFPKTLVVEIGERKRVGTWCQENVCFALDKKGVPFKEAENSEEYASFYSKGTAQLGKEILDPSLLALLLEFQEAFTKAGELQRFSVASFAIGDTGQVEVRTREGWGILLDTKEDMAWQRTKLQLVLQEKVPLEKRGELEYIDLRFGDQAYLKYKD